MSFMLNHAIPPVIIRGFRSEDLARLHAIDAVCFERGIAYTRAELAFYIRHGRPFVRVAECAGEIVGFAIGQIEANSRGHVITIDILPKARRNGLGTTLLRLLHGEFRGAGASLSVLEVDVGNGPAQAFYEGFGDKRMETLQDYYGSGRHAYRMTCPF